MNKITRTIVTKEYVISAIKLESGEKFVVGKFKLEGDLNTTARLIRKIKNDHKLNKGYSVYVSGMSEEKVVYEMPLETFMAHATRVENQVSFDEVESANEDNMA